MMMGKKQSPVSAALAQFIAALQEGDAASLKGGEPKSMKVEIEAEGDGAEGTEECPGCAAGECDNPEHMKPEDAEGLAEAYR